MQASYVAARSCIPDASCRGFAEHQPGHRQLTNLAVFKSAARAQRSEIKRRVSTSRLLHQLELLVSVAGLALPLPHLLALCSGTGVVEA